MPSGSSPAATVTVWSVLHNPVLPDGLNVKLDGLTETSPASLMVTVTVPDGCEPKRTIYSADSPSVTATDDDGENTSSATSSSTTEAVAESEPEAIVYLPTEVLNATVMFPSGSSVLSATVDTL